MKKSTRIISVMLCFAIIFSIALSASFIITHAQHDCDGTDCKICYHIHNCVQLLRELFAGSSSLSKVAAAGTICALAYIFFHSLCLCNTLIRMKVKLSC